MFFQILLESRFVILPFHFFPRICYDFGSLFLVCFYILFWFCFVGFEFLDFGFLYSILGLANNGVIFILSFLFLISVNRSFIRIHGNTPGHVFLGFIHYNIANVAFVVFKVTICVVWGGGWYWGDGIRAWNIAVACVGVIRGFGYGAFTHYFI